MVDILLYSILASGFAPSLTVLIILRALYGVAMGGEWGVGASLTMETIPPHARGFVSGLLQSGYPTGYFLASIVYGSLFPHIGWRGMFMVGVIPALLVLYIRRNVPESPSWSKETAIERGSTLTILKSHWRLGICAVVLMTAFNFFSHGTQDLYPTFLQVEHKLSPHMVGLIAVIYNIGAICGGILFGTLSERFGRRRCIIIAALLSLPVIPFWAFSDSPALLAIGAFLMQFTVQGAWGVVPGGGVGRDHYSRSNGRRYRSQRDRPLRRRKLACRSWTTLAVWAPCLGSPKRHWLQRFCRPHINPFPDQGLGSWPKVEIKLIGRSKCRGRCRSFWSVCLNRSVSHKFLV
jgi:MFS family permease